MPPPDFLYWYDAKVLRVVDGDTIDIDTDLGFRIRWTQRLRLYGLNTPELNASDPAIRAKAEEARFFVAQRLLGAFVGSVEMFPPKRVVMNTRKDEGDKYGRWLAVIHYLDAEGLWHNLNDELLQSGLAVPYMA